MYKELNESQQRDRRMYGCSEAELRESVEGSITYRLSGPAMVAMGMMSDAQEMVAYGPYDGDTMSNIMNEQRQLLNRAKWILSTYCMKGE
jgi:hypothetical protein